ncbi:hypothetical protein TNIN_72271 [Trichonephila inaurata madagascariensis]|uniref:Uncharacterized protein n=1 Tax=Trichonephila inaurata madagascariensis TaxID=2747483 RepID=A0A8X7CRP6_9ARAC|nr:hypothetical protein TNIN_72271 [Trichonephila inaurata madagascariensis]
MHNRSQETKAGTHCPKFHSSSTNSILRRLIEELESEDDDNNVMNSRLNYERSFSSWGKRRYLFWRLGLLLCRVGLSPDSGTGNSGVRQLVYPLSDLV